MSITLRQRILVTLLPLLVLMAVLGGAGILLLDRLGGSIKVILHENLDSVIAMQDLKEALERIDSSLQLTLVAGGLKNPAERKVREESARQTYENNWQSYRDALNKERGNITIHPQEDELVEQLVTLTNRYRKLGDDFYRRAGEQEARHRDYYSDKGLHGTFGRIKNVADDILHLNQNQMKRASDDADATALSSTIWLSVGLALAVLLAGVLAWHTVRSILHPIRAMTQAAVGISAGNLDQVLPYPSGDELGQLAQAFNTMAHRLRDYRQSQTARLLRTQETTQATIDSFPDPVIVVDSEGGVEMANPAARRLLGVVPLDRNTLDRKKHDAQGGHEVGLPSAFNLMPSSLRPPLTEALQGQRDYVPEQFDRAIMLGSGGRERAMLPRIMTIRDAHGHSLGAAVVLQDVTRLRLLDQVKSNLVATASHELKTPLTSIRLDVHLLLEEAVGPLTPKQMELLLDARENSERLLAMIDNLLDLARLEQGWRQLEVLPATPESLLRTAADAVRPRAEDKGVELVVDAPPDLPAVAVDAARLGHALLNLLGNALTYTERGGRVTLAARSGPDGVTFSVQDTGCGIPAEHLPHVFEKFFRVPGRSRGTGTGLGLAIAHEIVIAHGGTIACDSRPGAGTTFRFTLPAAAQTVGAVFGHADQSSHTENAVGKGKTHV